MIRSILITLLAWVAVSAHAQSAVTLAGVRYEPKATVSGTALDLNGAGIRYKFVVKVYTAGLYIGKKAATTEEVLAAPGTKRLHVVMLRDIDGNELGKLFVRGMQDNSTRAEFAQSIGGTIRMSDIFSQKKRLNSGESFTVDWVPGVGTVVSINGKPQGEPIKEAEFFRSLLRIWLGDKPADSQLKDALLGQSAAPAAGQTN